MQNWRHAGYVADSEDDDELDLRTCSGSAALFQELDTAGKKQGDVCLDPEPVTTHPSDKENEPAWVTHPQRRQKTFAKRPPKGLANPAADAHTLPDVVASRAKTPDHDAQGGCQQLQLGQNQAGRQGPRPTSSSAASPSLAVLPSTPVRAMTHDHGSVVGSAASSPLSEAGSDAILNTPYPEFWHDRAPSVVMEKVGTDEGDHQGNPWSRDESNIGSGRDANIVMAAPVRSFRRRTALQLHPYLIESEKYKQTMRAGGHKPVRLALLEDLTSTSIQKARPQRYETSSEPSRSQDSFLASSETQDAVDQSTNMQDGGATTENDTDPFELASPAPKRRKLFQIPVVTPGRPFTAPSSSGIQGSSIDTPPTSPPPPPPASLGVSKTSTNGFRLPYTTRSARTTNVDVQPKSDLARLVKHNSDGGRFTENVSSRSDTTSTTDSSSDSEVQFYSAKKRIRGVLPASWLRLSDKTKQMQSERRREGIPGRVDPAAAGVKGVAQRLVASHKPPGNAISGLEDFPEDSSDEDRPATSPVPRRRSMDEIDRRPARTLLDVDSDPDQMEDNAIDAMLAGGSRRVKRSGQSRKRQTKVTSTFSTAKRSNLHPIPQNSSRSGPTRSKSSRTRPQQKQLPLSIVDLESPSPVRRVRTPPFLRLAKRQERGRPDQARQLPLHKTIRLATRDDTADAMSTLTAWRGGEIARKHTNAVKPIDREATSRPRPEQSFHDVMARAQATVQAKASIRRESKADLRPAAPCQIRPSARTSAVGSARPQAVFHKTSSHIAIQPRGRLQHTAVARESFHAAQLEVDGIRRDQLPDHDSFVGGNSTYDLVALLRQRDAQQSNSRYQLERFLCDMPSLNAGPSVEKPEPADEEARVSVPFTNSRRERRKARPRRLSTEVAEFRQPPLPVPVPEVVKNVLDTAPPHEAGLRGLVRNTSFSVDFDVRHLHIGTFFQSRTFLGSGDFADAMNIRHRSFNEPAGRMVIHIDDSSASWSVWNDETAQRLEEIAAVLGEAVQCVGGSQHVCDANPHGPMETSIYLLRSLVRYISKCFYIEDRSCIEHFCNRTTHFIEDVADHLIPRLPLGSLPLQTQSHFLDCLIYVMILAVQVHIIATSASLAFPQSRLSTILQRICTVAFETGFSKDYNNLRAFLDRQDHHTIRDAGAQDTEVQVKLVVVMKYLTKAISIPHLSFDDILSRVWQGKIKEISDVSSLDRVWHDILTLQPLMELDASGIFRHGLLKANGNPEACWTVVKILLIRTFDLYKSTALADLPRANAYLVAVFARISLLINKWKWKTPGMILATVYDFFAQRGLAPLSTERLIGKHAFLKSLDGEPSLDIQPNDVAFQAFLKLLASGLKAVIGELPSTRTRSIAFRFLPNHGRTYRKDQEVRQSDLDALRNHHDLLSTLYWALPEGSRPKLEKIQDLVDFPISHLEACRINIDTWQNLAVFIMAHEQQHSEIPALGRWFCLHTQVLVEQYRLARSEAEELFEMCKDRQSGNISYDVMQMTVDSNQRRILAILQQAVAAMQRAVNVCHQQNCKLELVQSSGLMGLCKIFDAARGRTSGLVQQVLSIIRHLIRAESATAPDDRAGQSEESQDYGDWTALEELEGIAQPIATGKAAMLEYFHSSIAQILSNVFGAESPADEAILTSLTEIWSLQAVKSVTSGSRSWSDYLDLHGSCSWFQLPQTDALRKCTPLMLANVLRGDPDVLGEHPTTVIGEWVSSLAMPEYELRHQATLTSAIVNSRSSNPLLFNLQFTFQMGDKLDMALPDLLSRRSYLISTVLSNIRTALADARPSEMLQLKRSCTDVIRSLTAAMKRSFLDMDAVRAGSGPLSPAASHAHVSFLHTILASMQQHTVDVAPIDPFFNDPTAFPPPGYDPKYLVAKLKGYIPKLGTEKGRKQLVIFLQTVVSKAIRDGDMDLAIDQLSAAMSPTTDDLKAEGTGRSLRNVLVSDILPAYISLAYEIPAGAMFAAVVVLALGNVLCQVDLWADLSRVAVIKAEEGAMMDMLRQTVRVLKAGVTHNSAIGITFLTSMLLEVTKKLVSPVEFIKRSSGERCGSAGLLEEICKLCRGAGFRADEVEGAVMDIDHDNAANQSLNDVAGYARHSLGEELSRNWALEHGRLFHGNRLSKEEVYTPGLGTAEGEMERLQKAKAAVCREVCLVLHGDRYWEHSEGTRTGLADLCF